MVEQLKKLRDATELSNVTIRVLPFAAGLSCSPDSQFQILEFPLERNRHHREPPMVYSDSLTGALHLEKPDEIKAYSEVWKNLSDSALSHADSLDINGVRRREVPRLIEIEWRKASRSGQGANCVEVALSSTHVLVRDSKNPDGGVLCLDHREWRAFVSGVSGGTFDL